MYIFKNYVQLSVNSPNSGDGTEKIKANFNSDVIEISFDGQTLKRVFKLDPELKGTIALNPTFDNVVNLSKYKFLKSKIMRVV